MLGYLRPSRRSGGTFAVYIFRRTWRRAGGMEGVYGANMGSGLGLWGFCEYVSLGC